MGRKSSGGGTVKQRALAARGQPSQFESASVAKKRHNVIGDRNRSGKARSTLQARARSDQIRRETLLIEHQQKGRTNAFVDNRFGEEDEGMPEEDKLIHRFQRERQRQLKAAKKSGFSLEDGDSGGGSLGAPTELTHGGVALDIDNLSDGDFGDSEDDMPKHQRRKDDRGFEGADFVKRAHFGNDSDGEDGERKLSQKELLEETIAKYKQQKFERQDARREENNKIDEIDAEFDAIRGLIFQAGSKAEAKKKDPGTKSALALSRGEVDGHADFERLAAELSREEKPLVELPYVFTCPSDSAALGKLMDLAGPVVARQRTVLQRLIAGHHVKLKEANKEKLAKLAELLIERPLYPAIYSLAEQLPVPVALRMLDELQAVRSGWRQARKVLGGPGGSRHVSLPPPALAVLALLVQLYPLSDFRHVVVTPLVLLVQEVLAQPTPLPSSRVGVRRLLFLCSIALHLVGAAARWMPELHQVATALLEALMARGVEGGAKAGAAPQPLRFDDLHGDDDDEENGDEGGDGDEDDGKGPMDVDTAAAILRLVTDLARVGAPLPSYPELFGPMLAALTSPPAAASKRASEAQAGGKPAKLAKGGKKQAKQATPAADAASALPAGLRSLHKEAVGAVSDGLRAAIRTRKPLSMQKALAVPLKQFNPIFDDDFQPDQSMDPDRARAEKQKLQRKVKQEKKGAIRELRKDGQFLAAERQKEKEKRDDYLESREKRARTLLETQEADVKAMKKQKRNLTGF